MNKDDVSKKVNSTIDYIKSVEGTIIKQFIDLEPKNDFDYIKSWFYYLRFQERKNDFIEEMVNRAGDPEKAVFGHELRTAVDNLILDELDQKRKNLDFQPRLEQYVAEFEKNNQEFVRLIILAILWVIKNDDLGMLNLLGLGNKYNIPETFIFSLNSNHRLITDKVVHLEEDSILSRDFFGKDIVTNPLLFNIFADLPINEMDRAALRDVNVAVYFGLISQEDLDEISFESTDEFDDDWDDDNWDDEGSKDIESILSGLEIDEDTSNEETEKVEEYPEDLVDDEIKIYKSDAEYFLAEYEYYSILLKQADPPYEDSEDAVKKYPVIAKGLRNKCDLQLKKSIQSGFTPRFEKLAKDLKLNGFERDIVKCMIGVNVYSLENNYGFSIGQILIMLEKNPIKRLEYKRYFKKSSKLIRSGLIHVEERWDLNTSIFECKVNIDSRLVELLTGESFDISEYIEGTYLYSSGIKMKNVILPEEEKNKVMVLINNFDLIQSARKKVEFDKHFEYGNALVMLFTGPSGTGKTMLANAISNELDKKILLFNLNNLAQMSSIENAAIFQTLFREARLNNAILFFDESEAILSQRINDLLIEIERHSGIVIFATNASFEIDPAMRRRILHFTNFKDPGANLRKEIWSVHLYSFPKKLKLAKDVDLDYLASKYEISGGLIKNAIFTAMVKAVNDAHSDDPVIEMRHLMDGAKEQLENKYFMSRMEKVRIPHKGLDSLVVPDRVRETLNEVVNYEKARKILEGQWGFSQVFPDKNGIAVLFYGPPGTGKTLTAEAIAYETGKTLKQVNYAQVVSKYVGETEKALEALFTELADNKSILLFDEADALFAKRTEVSGSNSRYQNMETDLLLSLIERNNVFAILTTNNMENIDDAFYRRMTYIINFDKPGYDLRIQLWKTLIPTKLPLKGEIDYELLAKKYEFTGAEIKNVVIKTATRKALALKEDSAIETADFIEICDDFVRPDDMERKRVGFTNN